MTHLFHRMLWTNIHGRRHRQYDGLGQPADQEQNQTQRFEERFHLGGVATPLRGTSLPLISAPCSISMTP